MVDLFTFSVDELSCDVNSDFWPETIIVSRVVSPLPIGLSVEDFATVDVFFALVVDTPSEFLVDLLFAPSTDVLPVPLLSDGEVDGEAFVATDVFPAALLSDGEVDGETFVATDVFPVASLSDGEVDGEAFVVGEVFSTKDDELLTVSDPGLAFLVS